MTFFSQASKFNVITIALNFCWGSVAQANCADSIGSLAYFQPAMKRRWAKFTQQTTYPWGTTKPFKSLQHNTVVLDSSFNTLTGAQKRQVIAALGLDQASPSLFEDLTPEEKIRPGIGALSP